MGASSALGNSLVSDIIISPLLTIKNRLVAVSSIYSLVYGSNKHTEQTATSRAGKPIVGYTLASVVHKGKI